LIEELRFVLIIHVAQDIREHFIERFPVAIIPQERHKRVPTGEKN
jgi:hypothetical protein